MHTPFYNSKSTKIAFVADGIGHLEMACPHLSSSSGSSGRGRSTTSTKFRKVGAFLSPGVVFVVPAGHPFVTFAESNLQILCFDVNAFGNNRFTLTGISEAFALQNAVKHKCVLKGMQRHRPLLADPSLSEDSK
ncbi:Vicilin [Quillaja saponaria]|uniref:Vicilin n=1 Tax=Quillaja saponaria TaxID=32244 RepID=A0AAD7VJ18_QUISA|nr:Vicilin [Quillaja saponaria]